jgi:hypothetical protein
MVVHSEIRVSINNDTLECEHNNGHTLRMGPLNMKGYLAFRFESNKPPNVTSAPCCAKREINDEERDQQQEFDRDDDRREDNSYWDPCHMRDIYDFIDPCCLTRNSFCSLFSTLMKPKEQENKPRGKRSDITWEFLYEENQTRLPKNDSLVSDGKPFEFIMALEHSQEVEVVVIFENLDEDIHSPHIPEDSQTMGNSTMACESMLSLCSERGKAEWHQPQVPISESYPFEQKECKNDVNHHHYQSTISNPSEQSDSSLQQQEANTRFEAQDVFKNHNMDSFPTIRLSVRLLEPSNSHTYYLNINEKMTTFSFAIDYETFLCQGLKIKKKNIKTLTPAFPQKAQPKLYTIKRASPLLRSHRISILKLKHVKKLQPLSWISRKQNAELNNSFEGSKNAIGLKMNIKDAISIVIRITEKNLESLKAEKLRDINEGNDVPGESKCVPSLVLACSVRGLERPSLLSSFKASLQASEGFMAMVSCVFKLFNDQIPQESMMLVPNLPTVSISLPDSVSPLPISMQKSNISTNQKFNDYFQKSAMLANQGEDALLQPTSILRNALVSVDFQFKTLHSNYMMDDILKKCVSLEIFTQPLLMKLTFKPKILDMKHMGEIFQVKFRHSIGEWEDDSDSRNDTKSRENDMVSSGESESTLRQTDYVHRR